MFEDPKIRRFEDPKARRFEGSKARMFEGSKARMLEGSKIRIPICSGTELNYHYYLGLRTNDQGPRTRDERRTIFPHLW